MTTEDDFQLALDRAPEDYQTCLVFADWLQDRDDIRAEGYRAMGVLRIHPIGASYAWYRYKVYADIESGDPNADLPDDWFDELTGYLQQVPRLLRVYASHRAQRDAAALAFARLRPQRRAEIVAGTPRTTR